MKLNDLEERLIDFAVMILVLIRSISRSREGNHLSGQLIRSGTSSSLHYGEAQSAESKNDFIHKMKICLKELRETLICLKIIKKSGVINPGGNIDLSIKEADELIRIFVRSIATAERKR